MNKFQELNINQGIGERGISREFIRGQSLDFIMYLPKNVPEYYFRDWIPTAQLRKLNNPTKDGFIADLYVRWHDSKYTALLFSYLGDTSNWPLGPVEFDVVLTSPTGFFKVRTLPVRFTIVPGVTQ